MEIHTQNELCYTKKKKNILLYLTFSFCSIFILAQNNMPQSAIHEKAIFSEIEYDFDMMFEEPNMSGGRFGWTVSSATNIEVYQSGDYQIEIINITRRIL